MTSLIREDLTFDPSSMAPGSRWRSCVCSSSLEAEEDDGEVVRDIEGKA